jgi:hypothetical protein
MRALLVHFLYFLVFVVFVFWPLGAIYERIIRPSCDATRRDTLSFRKKYRVNCWTVSAAFWTLCILVIAFNP